MSETTAEETYVFPENSNNALCSGMMSMLGHPAQRQDVDPTAPYG